MGHQTICIICEINTIKERIVPKPTSFNKHRIKFLENKMIHQSTVKSLKPCSIEHRNIIVEARRKKTRENAANKFKRKNNLNNAKKQYGDALLLYTEMVNEYGHLHINTKRAWADVCHYRQLLGQRKRRLNELLQRT